MTFDLRDNADIVWTAIECTQEKSPNKIILYFSKKLNTDFKFTKEERSDLIRLCSQSAQLKDSTYLKNWFIKKQNKEKNRIALIILTILFVIFLPLSLPIFIINGQYDIKDNNRRMDVFTFVLIMCSFPLSFPTFIFFNYSSWRILRHETGEYMAKTTKSLLGYFIEIFRISKN